MTKPSLDDASDKLRWAKHHFEVLRSQIEPFKERDAHHFSVEVDPEAGKYTFYVHGLEVPDPDWGLIVGDCLHNARAALDYVAVNLWALVTGENPAEVVGVGFPVYDDPKKLAGGVGKLRKEPAFSGYMARIEELQPFNAGNPSIWGVDGAARLPSALDRLTVLDNIDKHRVVHVTWFGLRFMAGTIANEAPPEFVFTGASGVGEHALEDGAKIWECTFETPLPSRWEPTQVQMKRHFPIEVAFPDPSLLKGVLEILPWCISGVEAVMRIFAPVFEDGSPPLPVTAVKTVRG